MHVNPDDSVFPYEHPHKCGIDLRTWMATQFMAAEIPDQRVDETYETRAKHAVIAADALIAELNKPKP